MDSSFYTVAPLEMRTSQSARSGRAMASRSLEKSLPAVAPAALGRTERVERPSGLTREDSALVDAIRRGDAAAATPLYHRLNRGIEQTISRVLRERPAEFEDLVQVTYERVIRMLAAGKFEGRSQLTTWASAIAAHVAVDWLRRRRYEQNLFQSSDTLAAELQVMTALPERQLEARSEVRMIHGILARMNQRGAAMLLMHDVLGYSVPEVADMLGIQLSAAQSRLRRAREEFVRRYAAGQGARGVRQAADPAMLDLTG